MNLILLDFIIGSSYIISFGFFIFVYKKINSHRLNINYYDYTLIMPLWFGILNVISGILQKKYNLTDITRYLMISIFGLVVILFILLNYNIYNYNRKDLYKHIINVSITYLIVWIVLINSIQKLILNKSFHQYEFILFIMLVILYFSITRMNKITIQ